MRTNRLYRGSPIFSHFPSGDRTATYNELSVWTDVAICGLGSILLRSRLSLCFRTILAHERQGELHPPPRV
jgi:hypothetical protein